MAEWRYKRFWRRLKKVSEKSSACIERPAQQLQTIGNTTEGKELLQNAVNLLINVTTKTQDIAKMLEDIKTKLNIKHRRRGDS
jgi:transposase